MTVRELLTGALQDLSLVPGGGGVPDPSDIDLALSRLNDFIDYLANESLTIYTLSRATWTLVSGTASYTIGSGATINIERPNGPSSIQNIGYIDTSLTTPFEVQLGPVLTEDQYAAIPFKTLQAPLPNAFYYNPTVDASGYGSIKPFPIPNVSTLQGVVYAPAPVSEFTSLNQTILLPRGFRRFFRAQTVVEIAGAFERADAKALKLAMKIADESRGGIKRANERLSDITFDVALWPMPGPSNVYTGE